MSAKGLCPSRVFAEGEEIWCGLTPGHKGPHVGFGQKANANDEVLRIRWIGGWINDDGGDTWDEL